VTSLRGGKVKPPAPSNEYAPLENKLFIFLYRRLVCRKGSGNFILRSKLLFVTAYPVMIAGWGEDSLRYGEKPETTPASIDLETSRIEILIFVKKDLLFWGFCVVLPKLSLLE